MGMGRGAYAGQPLYFQCSACRKRKPWNSYDDPENLWRKGLLHRIKLTGRAKAINDGKANRRSANTRVEYRCLDCGHIGWTRHYTAIQHAIAEGLETPGEN